MATDFEAEIRNSLKSLTSQVTALGNSTTVVERKAGSMSASVEAAFRRTNLQMKKAAEAGGSVGESVKKIGEAAQRAGGPLGEIVGKLTGGAGMSGGLASAAVAAGLLGLALRVGTAVIDARIESTKKLIAATKALSDVKEAAAKKVGEQGLGAAGSQGQSLALLNTRGGPDAINEANDIAATGVASASDVRAGVAASHLRRSRSVSETMRRAALQAAGQVSSSGEGGFAEAVNAILSSPQLLEKLVTEGADGVAARVVVGNRGQVPNGQNVRRARYDLANQNHRAAFGETTSNGAIAALAGIAGVNNQLDEVGQNAIADGSAMGAARSALSAAKSPESAGMVALFAKQQQADDELRLLIKTQGRIMGDLKDVLMLIGGEGSYRNQLRKKQVAEAGAVFGE